MHERGQKSSWGTKAAAVTGFIAAPGHVLCKTLLWQSHLPATSLSLYPHHPHNSMLEKNRFGRAKQLGPPSNQSSQSLFLHPDSPPKPDSPRPISSIKPSMSAAFCASSIRAHAKRGIYLPGCIQSQLLGFFIFFFEAFCNISR
jgi:hypothetical protein